VTVVASAPGKIVLSGEYAVLFGAPAVCMAVKRRAIATVADSVDGECHVTTPGFTGEDSFGVVDAVYGDSRPARTIDLDSRAFSKDDRKLGIGSSAALTVALAAARRRSVDVFTAARDAHAVLQGGAGSGIDVAAAVHGGLIEYRMSSRTVRRLSWPDGLRMRVLWTGVPASTGLKLEQLATQSARPSRSALEVAAARMADAWRSGDADRILSEYKAYIGVLRQFSVDHDLGIFDAGHEELTDAAMVSNLIYKPAGAGGGDIGVLFGRDEAEFDAFVAKYADRIHGVVSCGLDSDGVRLEPV
jgi:phosphomevalonate kinase